MTTRNYVAVAYRWGASNAHQYLVAAGTDLEVVKAAAQDENAHRGGKYGVAVHEMTDRSQSKTVAYFPSMADDVGQIRPERNRRLDALQDVGIKVAHHLDSPKSDQLPAWLARFARRVFDNADKLQGTVEST